MLMCCDTADENLNFFLTIRFPLPLNQDPLSEEFPILRNIPLLPYASTDLLRSISHISFLHDS